MVTRWINRIRTRLLVWRLRLTGRWLLKKGYSRWLDNFGIALSDVKAHMRMLKEYPALSAAYTEAQRRYEAIPPPLRRRWLFPKRIAIYEPLRIRWDALFAESVMALVEERAERRAKELREGGQ